MVGLNQQMLGVGFIVANWVSVYYSDPGIRLTMTRLAMGVLS